MTTSLETGEKTLEALRSLNWGKTNRITRLSMACDVIEQLGVDNINFAFNATQKALLDSFTEATGNNMTVLTNLVIEPTNSPRYYRSHKRYIAVIEGERNGNHRINVITKHSEKELVRAIGTRFSMWTQMHLEPESLKEQLVPDHMHNPN